VRGVACVQLRQAFDQSQSGNDEALRRSVAAAAHAAEESLNRSGQVFGPPEKIALNLEYALADQSSKAREDAKKYLVQAREACERLGRWNRAP
jgi:hypothetical protein